MAGKASTPVKCKICDGHHLVCNRYTTIKVVPVPQPKRLALPAPKKAKKAKKVKA